MPMLRILALSLLITGCSFFGQPHVCDQFIAYEKQYCVARNELNTVIATANQAYRDETITKEQHAKALEAAKDADAILDDARLILNQGGEPEQLLNTVKSLLLRVK